MKSESGDVMTLHTAHRWLSFLSELCPL